MPAVEPATSLPTIQQRADAAYLTANLDVLQGRISTMLPKDIDEQREWVRRLPSGLLRELVRRGAGIVNEAHLAGTPIDRLPHPRILDLVEARYALAELTTRESAALDQLEADPPAYLVTAIGRPPPWLRQRDGISRRAWRDLAGRIEAYRLQYDIHDPVRTLGPRIGDVSQRADRSRVATDIAWGSFGLLPGRTDPGWLSVVGTPDQDPNDALAVLSDPAWRPSALASDALVAIQSRPSAVLRRHVQQALGVFHRRPPDDAMRRAHLQALWRQLTRLAGEPPKLTSQIASKVQRRLAEVRAELHPFDQAHRARLEWDALHTQIMATGRAAARELRRRELQVLLHLAEDPPTYLALELGRPPHGRVPNIAWLHGARAVISYRTTHEIDSPHPLGPEPTDDLARIHRDIAQRHLERAAQRATPRELEPPNHARDLSSRRGPFG